MGKNISENRAESVTDPRSFARLFFERGWTQRTSRTEQNVWLIINIHMDKKTALAWPSHTRIAEQTGHVGTRHISRAIKNLIKKKLLRIATKATGRQPAVYQVLEPVEMAKSATSTQHRRDGEIGHLYATNSKKDEMAKSATPEMARLATPGVAKPSHAYKEELLIELLNEPITAASAAVEKPKASSPQSVLGSYFKLLLENQEPAPPITDLEKQDFIILAGLLRQLRTQCGHTITTAEDVELVKRAMDFWFENDSYAKKRGYPLKLFANWDSFRATCAAMSARKTTPENGFIRKEESFEELQEAIRSGGTK